MDSLANSLMLLTKTNSKIVDKLKEVDAKIDSVNISNRQSLNKIDSKDKSSKKGDKKDVDIKESKKGKTVKPVTKIKADVIDKKIVSTVEKPKTVIISDFTKEALTDLAGIIGKRTVMAKDSGPPLKDNDTLKKILGLIAAAIGTYAIAKNFKVENIPGLIQGLQGARRQLIRARTRIRRSFSRIGNIAKRLIPKPLRDAVRNSFSKFRKSAIDSVRSARRSIVNGLTNMGTRIATMSKNLGEIALEKITKNFNAFKNAALAAVKSARSSLTNALDNMATQLAQATSRPPSSASGSRTSLGQRMSAATGQGSTNPATQNRFRSTTPQPRGNWFTRGVSYLGDKTKAAYSATKSAAVSTVNTGANMLGDAKDAVVDVTGRAVNYVSKKVDDAFTGIKDGIRYVKGKAVQAGEVVLDGVIYTKKAATEFVKKNVLPKIMYALGGAKKLATQVIRSPLLAPVVESVFAYSDIKKAIKEYKEGEITKEELDEKVGTRAVRGMGGIMGGALGAIAGGMTGTAIMGAISVPTGGILAPAGALLVPVLTGLGGVAGDMVGRFLGGLLATGLGPVTDKFGAGILDTPVFKGKMEEPLKTESIPIEDGIITKSGQLIKPHDEDFLYAMKDGGPLVNAMSGDNKATEKNNELLSDFKTNSHKASIKQIELLEKNNSLLTRLQGSIVELNSNGSGSKPSNVVSSSNSNVTNVNFKSPGLRDIQLSYG